MQTQKGGGRPRERTFTLLAVGSFFLLAALNLLRGEWLGAAFFLSGGLVFLERRRVDRWPKPARYLVTLALAALAVAMFVRLVMRARGGV